MGSKIIYKDLSYLINGLCFKVHNDLGRFRTERSYGDYLEQLFKDNNVSYKREAVLPPSFTAENPGRNRTDFIIADAIVLELKAKQLITKDDYFQMKRYLEISKLKLGILVNFRQLHISPKRILN